MKKPKKRHHYIPAFYLGGFTDNGLKNGQLWVMDYNNGKYWQEIPRKIAFSNDFYSLNSKFAGKNDLEEFFAVVENQSAPIIRKIENAKIMATGDEYDLLMFFMAIMATRVPAFRNIIYNFIKQIVNDHLEDIFSSKDYYDKIIEMMRKDGKYLSGDLNYENMKEFVFSDRCKIRLNKNWYAYIIISMAQKIWPRLCDRKWQLFISTNPRHNFICSDRPLSIRWIRNGQSIYPPGFALRNTFVCMPLSKSAALIGIFDGGEDALEADDDMSALINSSTIMYSERHIYFGENDFIYYKKDMTIGNKDDLIKEIRKA